MRIRAAILILLLAGCATVGHDFDSTGLSWLKAGETSKAQVLEQLGNPFRVGIDSGDLTWTYGFYRYKLIGQSNAKDLVIRFHPDGKVKSFMLNTTFPEEKKSLDPESAGQPE